MKALHGYPAKSGEVIKVDKNWGGLKIQVEGVSSVTVKGTISGSLAEQNLPVVSMVDFSVGSAITADGIYELDTSWLESVKLTFASGTVLLETL